MESLGPRGSCPRIAAIPRQDFTTHLSFTEGVDNESRQVVS